MPYRRKTVLKTHLMLFTNSVYSNTGKYQETCKIIRALRCNTVKRYILAAS